MSQMIRCKHCHQWVPANPRIQDQRYCNRKKCQRARKAEWQRAKLKIDPQYKASQDDAKAKWRRENPGYSKQYRDANSKYGDRNRKLQKMRDQKRLNKSPGMPLPDVGPDHLDPSIPKSDFITESYTELNTHLAKMDASAQINHLKSNGYIVVPKNVDLAKMDASKDKFNIIPVIYIDLAKMDSIDFRKMFP